MSCPVPCLLCGGGGFSCRLHCDGRDRLRLQLGCEILFRFGRILLRSLQAGSSCFRAGGCVFGSLLESGQLFQPATNSLQSRRPTRLLDRLRLMPTGGLQAFGGVGQCRLGLGLAFAPGCSPIE